MLYGGKTAEKIARELDEYLRSQKLDPVVAAGNSTPVRAGESLEESLLEIISGCDVVVAVWTDESIGSWRANDELQFAYEQRKPIIPFVSVTTKDSLPRILQAKCRICFDVGKPQEKFERVIQDIRTGRGPYTWKSQTYASHALTITRGFRIRKLVECLDACLDGYDRSSYAEACTVKIPFDPSLHSGLPFVRLGRGVRVPRDWFEGPLVDSSFFFMQLGIEVDCAEARYIVNQIKASGRMSIDIREPSPENLARLFDAASGSSADLVLLAPISHYVQIHGWNDNRLRSPMVTYEGPEVSFLMSGDRRARLLWSNNSVPFDEFMLVDRTALDLVAKIDEQTHHRVEAFVYDHPTDKEALVAEASTHINLTVTDPDKVVIGKLGN